MTIHSLRETAYRFSGRDGNGDALWRFYWYGGRVFDVAHRIDMIDQINRRLSAVRDIYGDEARGWEAELLTLRGHVNNDILGLMLQDVDREKDPALPPVLPWDNWRE